MAIIYKLMRRVVRTIPVLFAKIGTFFLLLFAVGMAAGYFFATLGYNYFVLFVPVVAMAVMWQKLDEGAMVFIVLMAIVFFFPELFVA